jgi:hypothetical protein
MNRERGWQDHRDPALQLLSRACPAAIFLGIIWYTIGYISYKKVAIGCVQQGRSPKGVTLLFERLALSGHTYGYDRTELEKKGCDWFGNCYINILNEDR